jgi:RNA polymerase sigma-70 factor (ECF subfamily)
VGFDEDRILIEQVLSGRVEAFEELIRKYQKPVFYFVQRMLRRQEDSDEVTQKTFVQAYLHLSKFRFESSFKTWVTKIAINLAKNYLRKAKRSFYELNDQMADGKSQEAFQASEKEQEKTWLRESLEELPPMQKQVIEMRIYDELSFKEISEIVGSREGSCKVNFHHGMKRLKELFQKRKSKGE